jgi:prevent-host-death family protein
LLTNLTILVRSEVCVTKGAWSLAEAKAKFSEVVELASTQGPQHVTRSGRPAVVIVSEAAWADATSPRRSFLEALLDPAARVLTDEEADTVFARDPDPGRPVDL